MHWVVWYCIRVQLYDRAACSRTVRSSKPVGATADPANSKHDDSLRGKAGQNLYNFATVASANQGGNRSVTGTSKPLMTKNQKASTVKTSSMQNVSSTQVRRTLW